MLTRFLSAGIESGDWLNALEYAIAPAGPINAGGRTLAILFPQGSGGGDDDPLEDAPLKHEITKLNGVAGSRGVAGGAGIWASGSLDQALVSDNSTFERSRTRSLRVSQPPYSNPSAGLFDIPNRH